MQLWNNTQTLWLLCLVSMIGIIGMLLLDGVWDWIMLLITALPIVIAIYRMFRINYS